MLSQTTYQNSFLIDSGTPATSPVRNPAIRSTSRYQHKPPLSRGSHSQVVPASANSASPTYYSHTPTTLSNSGSVSSHSYTPVRMTSTDGIGPGPGNGALSGSGSGSPSGSINHDDSKPGKKNVPFEFTSHGTTPSGKPRLFVCQVCTRAFARLEHLRRHERSHTKEKPFSCGVCQRKFSRRDLLLRHAQKLHAGCSDAITRLRRKSIKRSNSTSTNNNDDDDIYDLEDDDEDVDMDREVKSQRRSSSTSQQNFTPGSATHNGADPKDPVHFNLNLFDPSQLPGNKMKASPLQTPRKNSIAKDSNTPLQRQVFDQRKKLLTTRSRRGASFSAQSGANYSIGLSEFNEIYPNTENVEFSTPQMLPSSMNDEISWLSNLSTIPGMVESNLPNQPQVPPNQKFTAPNFAQFDSRQNSISSALDNVHSNPPPNVSHHGSFSHKLAPSSSHDHLRSNSASSNYDNMASIPFMMPTATITSQELQHGIAASSGRAPEPNQVNQVPQGVPQNQGLGQSRVKDETPGDYGYSFYDIPEPIGKSLDGSGLDANLPHQLYQQSHQPHVYKVLTPIKQEIEEEMAHNERSGAKNVDRNFDLNFLNDIDELTQGFDVSSKFMPNGYSFYGDNPSVSSSGIETNSPSVLSPSLQFANGLSGSIFGDSTLDHTQLLDIEHAADKLNQFTPSIPQGIQNPSQPLRHPNQQHQFPNQQQQNQQHPTLNDHTQINSQRVKLGNFSKNKLFTNNLRQMLHRSLSKYPISGIINPSIPSNEKLEFYLSKFNQEFLSHFPFIHQSKLNEYEMMNMTINEDWNNESARVCLPLLIATIGALFANNKRDSEHLYEASRRTIHIYLESRKNSVGNLPEKDSKDSNSTVNPLWLIQSLMLSVIYGLFSDNENNVYIVIRQLSALNSLVKTSIKSKRSLLFSVSGEDEECFNKISKESNGASPSRQGFETSLFSNTFQQELKFKNNINVQSQTRIVLIIYRLTNFLLMMYNVPLTLSINDLGGVCVPNRNDELLWGFKNYQEFQEYSSRKDSIGKDNSGRRDSAHGNLDDYLNGEKIVYKDLVLKLAKLNTNDLADFQNQEIYKSLYQVSRFAFTSITHGLFELKQYQETKSVDIFTIIDSITKFFPQESVHAQNHGHPQNVHNQQAHTAFRDYEKLDYALLANFTKISSIIDFKLVKEQSWLRNYDELNKNYSNFLNENNPNTRNISDYDYVRIVDCCLMIVKLILFKSEDDSSPPENFTPGGVAGLQPPSFSTDFGFLNNGFGGSNEFGGNSFSDLNSLLSDDFSKHGNGNGNANGSSVNRQATLNGEENTLGQFEKALNIKIFEEFDISSISMHSQMLFHVFAILSVFSIYVSKKNNPVNLQSNSNNQHLLFELNHRFSMTLKLLDKVESFLKVKYQQQGNEGVKSEVLDQFFSNLYLYNGNVDSRKSDNENNYTLEKTLYILKIGEVVLNYVFDSNIKVSIFKKLSGSLAQIRKFLIDNEGSVLG